MIRVLMPLLLLSLSTGTLLPEVSSYSRVAKNGQEEEKSSLLSWIGRALAQNNETGRNEETEGRSSKDIVITVSPVYVPPRTPKLKNGEAIDYPSTRRYSTLDHDMLSKLDAAVAQKQIQDRYHPSTSIRQNGGQSVPFREQNDAKVMTRPSPPSDQDSFDFSESSFPGTYDYKPPDYFGDKPISKPVSMADYSDTEIRDKPPDSYKPQQDSYYPMHDEHDTDFSDVPPGPTYNGDSAPKPIEFSGHLDHPPFAEDPYDHDYHHHELIYDHVPEYHEHHHDHTEQPEMNDQRLDKRPYSYYFIGKKLWYVPLYFSIYFIIYIAALVLKSIARHKISFPAHLAEAVGHSRKIPDTSWWEIASRVLEGVENFAEKFGGVS